METRITFAIMSRDGDILYRTEDGKEYVVKTLTCTVDIIQVSTP